MLHHGRYKKTNYNHSSHMQHGKLGVMPVLDFILSFLNLYKSFTFLDKGH
jgi:hypothetical protein